MVTLSQTMTMLPIERALGIVLQHATELPPETIDFMETPGRILREDVISDVDMPPFPRSAVDGFALRAEDVSEGKLPRRLKVVGSIPAGTYPDFGIGSGEAAQIMTGAPVPEGADAVQMVEQTSAPDKRRDLVEVLAAVRPGQNVAPRGSEVKKGDVVLRTGTRLDPPAVAVAASVGKTTMRVGRRPTAAVIATGDELVPPSEKPEPGQIRNSNGFSLVAQCHGIGVRASYLGVAMDRVSSLEEKIAQGFAHDVILLSGGVSMGRFDLVEGVLERLGVRLLIDAVALKPGKPLVFGVKEDGKLVFGLPGNPVSTMVTFELFVRTAIARMEGAVEPVRALVRARLEGSLTNRGPRRAYLPGWLATGREGELLASPIATRGSGDIVAFSKANALLVVPEDRDRLEPGESIRCYPLDSFLYKDDRWRVSPSRTN